MYIYCTEAANSLAKSEFPLKHHKYCHWKKKQCKASKYALQPVHDPSHEYLDPGRSSSESVRSMATDARGTSMQGLTSRGLFPKGEDIEFLTQMVSWSSPYVRLNIINTATCNQFEVTPIFIPGSQYFPIHVVLWVIICYIFMYDWFLIIGKKWTWYF